MLNFSEILADVQRNWFLYLSMPFVAALIGYVTKLVAIRMMFEPIEFVGKPPYLGWQGIVPRKAPEMAAIACDLMTSRLIKPADVFARLDPYRVAREIEKPLFDAVEDITREVATQFQPGLWESIPESFRQRIIKRVQAESPEIVAQIMHDIKHNIDEVFDLKEMVVTQLLRDKQLLNRIFLEVGHTEFKFIAHSGIYFGFMIGIVQAVTWALTHSPWIMPLFGLFTGWFTDWLALRMVFRPKLPKKYLGIFEWQGLFHKRRKQVAAKYGELIANEIVTPTAVLDAVVRNQLSTRLFTMVHRHIQTAIDEQAGIAKPIVVLAVGGAKFQAMKQAIAQKVVDRLPDTLRHVERYAGEAMDIRNTLTVKMQELTEDEFEGLLRPAFQQDEWKLIAVGAALGFLVGELQVFIMLHA
jgi:uncharacterized membrane protein YheB (UPF0754 family)